MHSYSNPACGWSKILWAIPQKQISFFKHDLGLELQEFYSKLTLTDRQMSSQYTLYRTLVLCMA